MLYDSLTSGNYDSQQLEENNPNGWVYYGSASIQNAPVEYYADTTNGLYLGVQALQSGQWSGFFAVTPDLDAQLYHTVLTMPHDSIPSADSFNTGLYVQTHNGLINYVTCALSASPSGHYWAVVRTTGNFDQATEFEVLWRDDNPGQPLTRDCTIVTNGDNFLQVYLDGNLVFASESLNLQMEPPFNAFIEVQSSHPDRMLFSTYKDFYATVGSSFTVENVPPGGTVKVVSSGSVIASETVSPTGTVIIDIGKYHFPLTASIVVHNADGQPVASTSSDVQIWSGDAYSLEATTTTTSSSSSSTTTSFHTIQKTTTAESSKDYHSNKGYEYPRKPDMHILPDSLFFFEEDEKLNKQAKSKKTSK